MRSLNKFVESSKLTFREEIKLFFLLYLLEKFNYQCALSFH